MDIGYVIANEMLKIFVFLDVKKSVSLCVLSSTSNTKSVYKLAFLQKLQLFTAITVCKVGN